MSRTAKIYIGARGKPVTRQCAWAMAKRDAGLCGICGAPARVFNGLCDTHAAARGCTGRNSKVVVKTGIGLVVEIRRKALGLSVGGLARKAEVTMAFLSALRHGHHTNPTLRSLQRLAAALNTTASELIEGL